MKKLIALFLTTLFVIGILISNVYLVDYYPNEMDAKYAAIPPVKLPPVPPKD